jgi:hypothetical protein
VAVATPVPPKVRGRGGASRCVSEQGGMALGGPGGLAEEETSWRALGNGHAVREVVGGALARLAAVCPVSERGRGAGVVLVAARV